MARSTRRLAFKWLFSPLLSRLKRVRELVVFSFFFSIWMATAQMGTTRSTLQASSNFGQVMTRHHSSSVFPFIITICVLHERLTAAPCGLVCRVQSYTQAQVGRHSFSFNWCKRGEVLGSCLEKTNNITNRWLGRCSHLLHSPHLAFLHKTTRVQYGAPIHYLATIHRWEVSYGRDRLTLAEVLTDSPSRFADHSFSFCKLCCLSLLLPHSLVSTNGRYRY